MRQYVQAQSKRSGRISGAFRRRRTLTTNRWSKPLKDQSTGKDYRSPCKPCGECVKRRARGYDVSTHTTGEGFATARKSRLQTHTSDAHPAHWMPAIPAGMTVTVCNGPRLSDFSAKPRASFPADTACFVPNGPPRSFTLFGYEQSRARKNEQERTCAVAGGGSHTLGRRSRPAIPFRLQARNNAQAKWQRLFLPDRRRNCRA